MKLSELSSKIILQAVFLNWTWEKGKLKWSSQWSLFNCYMGLNWINIGWLTFRKTKSWFRELIWWSLSSTSRKVIISSSYQWLPSTSQSLSSLLIGKSTWVNPKKWTPSSALSITSNKKWLSYWISRALIQWFWNFEKRISKMTERLNVINRTSSLKDSEYLTSLMKLMPNSVPKNHLFTR